MWASRVRATALAHTKMPLMKKARKPDPLAERPDLDFSKGTRGKYTNLLAKGTNVAIIDPAFHSHFPDSESVNRALRAFLAIKHELKEAASPSAPAAQQPLPRPTSTRAWAPNPAALHANLRPSKPNRPRGLKARAKTLRSRNLSSTPRVYKLETESTAAGLCLQKLQINLTPAF